MLDTFVKSANFKIPKQQLDLDITLFNAQSFRWHKIIDNNYQGVIHSNVWVLSQTDDQISCKLYDCNNNVSDLKTLFFNYFNLNVDINHKKAYWFERDQALKKFCDSLHGLRILRQDIVENLFSFICSSNNNVKRITKMIQNLCTNYGNKLPQVNGIDCFTFPTVQRLAQDKLIVEQLKSYGFGYRAKYIFEAAKYIQEKEDQFILNKENGDIITKASSWLAHLRDECTYSQAHKELIQIPGIGPKVADCICLMSLNKMEAFPIDTHVWNIAKNLYYIPALHDNPHKLQQKTLTQKTYNDIGDFFRSLYGPYAGWAHSYLFTFDLRKMKLPTNVKVSSKSATVKKSKK